MTRIAASPRWNTRSVHWFSTSHGGTRSDSQLLSQIPQQCSAFDPIGLDKNHLLMRRTLFGHRDRWRGLHSDPSSAALNSP